MKEPDGRNVTTVELGLPIRSQFPIFLGSSDGSSCSSRAQGQVSNLSTSYPLSYLDSAASTQKHISVIDRISRFLSFEHANIHRGAYRLSAEASERYDEARGLVAGFVGAPSARNLIFTRGTTEAINLIAYSLEHHFQKGDCILLTLLEHHSNIVPWQLMAARRGVTLAFADINDDATLNLDDFRAKLRELKPKLVSLTALANSFGSLVPFSELVAECRKAGAFSVVDAAQVVAHMPIDVASIGCDFLAFSGHKLYGPTGIGALYVNERMYEHMNPFQGGGDMISQVSVDGSTWAEPPQKFEAGTPAIAEAIAMGTAAQFVQSLGWKHIARHEEALFDFAWERLLREDGVVLYGPRSSGNVSGSASGNASGNAGHASIIAFNVAGVHPHDFSTIADSFNVQVRAGHHCAMPTLKRLGLASTVRASFGVYSCEQDVEHLCLAIQKARSVFA